jgi:predicted lysophospholipase L1 biosynthesis ABC-type transport system permease subunit
MASAESNTRYTLLPRPSEDTVRESSPHEHLLPSINKMRLPRNYSATLNPVVLLRIIASILSLTTFLILVIDGGNQFIAADIFVMCILILDIFMVLHHSVSHVFKVTVELRQQAWSRDLGSQNKPKVSTYFDYGLSMCLLICLIIGNGVKNRWDRGAWQAAVIVGYVVV